MLTRWEQWYSQDNLDQDERILTAPPSLCAQSAAAQFLSRGKTRVLDLACGVGRDSFYLEERGLDVTGVDASLNGLRAASRIRRRRNATAELVAADARLLPFGDESFEGVYCFGLLHEFTSERKHEDVEQVMAEVGRVLCQKGVLVLAVLSGEAEAGLPAVQMFTRQMFEQATQNWRPIEIRAYDDVGCTSRPDYRIWYGVFEK
jgi:ubiquinone/menaquinone biosynthesis C-methylase UbiE